MMDNFELAQLRGEEQFHLEEEEFYGNLMVGHFLY